MNNTKMKTKGMQLALAAAAITACRTVAQPGSQSMPEARKEPQLVLDASPVREARVEDAGPKETKPPEPAPRWSKVPEATGELFSVVDGYCSHLGVAPLENATLVHHRHNGKPVVAVLTDEGTVRSEPAMTRGLGDVYYFQGFEGRWPDAAWLSFQDAGRCSVRYGALRFTPSGWKPAFTSDLGRSVSSVTPYKEGALAFTDCRETCGDAEQPGCPSSSLVGDGVKAPPMTGDAFRALALATLPTGEVYVAGKICKEKTCTGQLRWWSPGTKLATASLGTADARTASILARSKTEVFIAWSDELSLFDGAKVSKITPPSSEVSTWIDAGDAGVWLVGQDNLFARRSDGTFEDITPPKDSGAKYSRVTVSGAKVGAPWAIRGGALWKRASGAWQRVELPKPPFSSTKAYLSPSTVNVRAPDDVWVTATYHEQQAGWNEVEKRTTVLHTKRPKETLRCWPNPTGDNAQGASFVPWPAPATEACATPFVVLAGVSASAPKDHDYPKTRSLFLSKLDLVADEGVLHEVRENGSTWVGVRPKSVEAGRKLAQIYASAFAFSRPDVICTEPTTTRTIPIDPKAKKDGGM